MMRVLLLTTSVLLRAYPQRWRMAWAGECLDTFQQRCADVAAARGPIALAQHVLAEWMNLLREAVRLRRPRPSTARTPGQPGRFRRSLAQDLRQTVRSFRAAPAHTAIALLTLALGIGANAGLYSVLDALLFRPVPFAEGHRLTELMNYSVKGGVRFPGFNGALLREWRAQVDLIDRVEAYDDDFAVFEGAGGAEVVDMSYVTPGLLPLLGVAPREGRLFGDGEGRDGTDARVILSERSWRKHFGARRDIVGSTLQVNGRSVEVVGVMPASFHFPYRSTELWMPRDPMAPPAGVSPAMTMTALARLAPGVSAEAAEAEVQARGERLQEATGGRAGVTAVTSSRARDSQQRRMFQVLAASVAFLLLIVCANLANLSLSKVLARGRDLAVRAALGASRRDLVREAFVEHVTIGLLGAALGLLIAGLIVALANDVLPVSMVSRSLNPIDLDMRVAGVALAAGVLTPLLFGLPAALLASRTDISHALTQQSRSTTGSRAAARWRNGLVVAEVTLAMVLLLGAALMARSLYSLISVDRGFETSGLIALRVGLPATRYADPRVRDSFSEAVVDAVRRMPQVGAVTVGNVPPNPSGSSFGAFEFAHRPGTETESMLVPSYRVWPDYFDQIGLPLVDGRAFEPAEPLSSAIVSETFARRFWPDGSAVGGQFRFTGSTDWRTVVGVSTEVRQMATDDADGSFEFFTPLRTPAGVEAPRRVASAVIVEHRTFVARTSAEGATLESMKRAVHQIDPAVVVWSATSVDDAFSNAVAQPRLVLVVLGAMAGLGLLLAAAGIYGVLSFMVTLRLREFGVRLALGARPAHVFGTIVRYGLVLTTVGLAVGAGASVFLIRLMQSLLYEVEPSDPVAMLAVPAVLAAAALIACWRPARRAMRVDPVQLLRES